MVLGPPDPAYPSSPMHETCVLNCSRYNYDDMNDTVRSPKSEEVAVCSIQATPNQSAHDRSN